MDLNLQKSLTDSLDRASRNYYNGVPTEYTDIEFDLKFKELQAMEKKSGKVFPNSPTLRVGSDIQDGFKKGTHPKPMLTIENVFSDEELQKWVDKMHKDYGVEWFNISVKYDGISCELHYKDGVFVQALTRGDKNVGDDITENVRTIKNIPLVLRDDIIGHVGNFYVRGEILLPKSRLAVLNEERKLNGEQIFSNTRNACAGSVKQLDPKVTASRGLIFRAWDCFGDYEFESMEDKVTALEGLGFYYEGFLNDYKAQFFYTKPFSVRYEDLVETVNRFKETLSKFHLDYDYDGIVIKVDDVAVQDRIGTKDTRAIEWGIARKWNEENIVSTKLLEVEWQVGRTGVLTPVARLEPVECGGVVITNVTLHNWDFIKEKGIRIGATLKITRSGGVIPYVLGVECANDVVYVPYLLSENMTIITNAKNLKYDDKFVSDKFYDNFKTDDFCLIDYPKKCPICGSPTIKEGAVIKCSNLQCPAIIKGEILQFCSKDCMDIRTIGESVVNDLVDKEIISRPLDLYAIKEKYPNGKVFANKMGEGYGATSCQKILDSIEESKKQPFERVLYGLSIPGVGKVTARLIAAHFKNFQDFIDAPKTSLLEIEGIGEKMANDIYRWIHYHKRGFGLVLALEEYGLKTTIEETPTQNPKSEKLTGLTICFSGSSKRFHGDEVEEYLESHGAKCTHSVTKKIGMLIVGENPGPSKVKKAEDYGIRIIEENNFYKEFGL